MKNILQPLGLAILLALPLAAADKTATKSKAPGRPINLNTATATELTQLPKIGAKAAERIVAYRKQHGSFQRAEDLLSVKGIGEKSFLKLKPYLNVGGGSAQAKATPKSQGK
jgi:competence protein ComEA